MDVDEAVRRDGRPGRQRADAGHGPNALRFGVATSLADVVDAWRLVYRAYRRIEIIPPNAQGIFTSGWAVGSHVAVLAGWMGARIVSTLTVIPDSGNGLPLDEVYAPQLNKLRDAGATLIEYGLFADRRANLMRGRESLLQMMAWAYHFSMLRDMTDCVIGVHPHHARFYMRLFGMRPVGGPSHYASLNRASVQLLHGSVERSMQERPEGLARAMAQTMDARRFEERFGFEASIVRGSPIDAFLRGTKVRLP